MGKRLGETASVATGELVLFTDHRLYCMRGWSMGMRLCESGLVSRPQTVLLDYTGIYIQCESGLALASFLPPVFDRNCKPSKTGGRNGLGTRPA